MKRSVALLFKSCHGTNFTLSFACSIYIFHSWRSKQEQNRERPAKCKFCFIPETPPEDPDGSGPAEEGKDEEARPPSNRPVRPIFPTGRQYAQIGEIWHCWNLFGLETNIPCYLFHTPSQLVGLWVPTLFCNKFICKVWDFHICHLNLIFQSSVCFFSEIVCHTVNSLFIANYSVLLTCYPCLGDSMLTLFEYEMNGHGLTKRRKEVKKFRWQTAPLHATFFSVCCEM